ncbi:MAG: hypothetical protein KKB70_10440, partial [Proteobacteria bacterium]|nr:hypothetical protein [Pseudomonadota bacterium]
PGWSPGDLNRSLAAAKNIPFAMAPITWDAAGRASQKLYLFTPTETGYSLSDVEGIAHGIERAKSKREQRLKTWKATQQSTAAKKKAAQ